MTPMSLFFNSALLVTAMMLTTVSHSEVLSTYGNICRALVLATISCIELW
jgi:hypothetical protein